MTACAVCRSTVLKKLCITFKHFSLASGEKKHAAKHFVEQANEHIAVCCEENETFLVSAVKANKIKKLDQSLIQYLHQGTLICTDRRDLWKLHQQRPEYGRYCSGRDLQRNPALLSLVVDILSAQNMYWIKHKTLHTKKNLVSLGSLSIIIVNIVLNTFSTWQATKTK